MVFLSPRFTLLAVFCNLAVISLSSLSASAVAIQAHDSSSPSSKGVVTGRNPIHDAPVLPMPPQAKKKSATRQKNEDRSYHNQAYFGDRSTSKERESHLHVDRPHHDRRSSLIVAGQYGKSYIVSPTPRAPTVHRRFDSTDGQAYFDSEGDDHGEIPGQVDIMSPAANAQQYKKLGSLYMDPKTRVFKASDTDVTEMRMVTVPGAMASNSSMRVVMMKVMMFNAASTDLQSYCATTHTQGGSSDMTAEPCDPQSVNPSQNQMFDYNVDNGVVNPTQIAGQDDGKTDDVSGSSSGSTDPAVASVFGERDAGDTNNAQTVELVFVSKAPEVANVEDTPGSPQVTVVTATTTMTSTFTYTTSMTALVSAADVVPTSVVTSSDSAVTSALVSTSSISAADASPTSATISNSVTTSTSAMSAAAVDSTSSADASSSSIVTPSTDTLSVAGVSSTSPVIASSSSATSSASSVPSLDALDVQVVAPVSSSVTSTTVTSTSATPTPSINADALASSIAASFASNRAEAASSTMTSTVTAAAMDASSSVASSSVSSSMPSMTPVSTAPYTYMFKVGKE